MSWLEYNTAMKGKIEQLKSLPQLLRSHFNEMNPALRTARPKAGGFSLTEQICHLRDLEREGYLFRIEQILQKENPELPNFHGAKVAAERNYQKQNALEALDSFESARNQSIRVLSKTTENQFHRTGVFAGSRSITLSELVDMMLEHDQSHAQELADLEAEIQRLDVE